MFIMNHHELDQSRVATDPPVRQLTAPFLFWTSVVANYVVYLIFTQYRQRMFMAMAPSLVQDIQKGHRGKV